MGKYMTAEELLVTINTPNKDLWLVNKNSKDVVFAPVYAKDTEDTVQVCGQWISVACRPAIFMVIETINIKKTDLKDWFFLLTPLEQVR